MQTSLTKKVTFATTSTQIDSPAVADTETRQSRVVGALLTLLRKLKAAVLVALWTIFTIVAPALIIIMVFKVCIFYVLTARLILNNILELVR